MTNIRKGACGLGEEYELYLSKLVREEIVGGDKLTSVCFSPLIFQRVQLTEPNKEEEDKETH